MEPTIQNIIYIHATFGGIALISGFISIVSKKGQKAHKTSGLIFFYTMLISAVIAMIIALLPNHYSPFLFAVGIFSLYFVLSGKRALRFKYNNPDLRLDRWISRIMILSGILMVLLPLVITKSINIVLSVFAVIGIIFAVRDLSQFKNPECLREKWLKLHLGKMTGGYIAATTAFVVVNGFFPGVVSWFAPGIIGGFFIAFWIRKLNKKKKSPMAATATETNDL